VAKLRELLAKKNQKPRKEKKELTSEEGGGGRFAKRRRKEKKEYEKGGRDAGKEKKCAVEGEGDYSLCVNNGLKREKVPRKTKEKESGLH